MQSAHSDRPKTTSQWLFEELRIAIIRGELVAGEPVRQDMIAELYNVSRMPVREAMRLLEAEGLVEQRPHRGAVVADLDANDALELFEIREALEAIGVKRSFPNLSDEQIADIEKAHLALNQAPAGDLLLRHREFHLALYAAAGPRLLKLIADQIDAAQRYHLRFGREDMEVSDRDAEDHREFVRAARKRDVKTALAIMKTHLGKNGQEISNSITQRKQAAPDST